MLASCIVQPEPFDLTEAKVVSEQELEQKPTTGSLSFVPDTKEFDWIRLNSEEWLKGELLSLRDGDLEFDSDELDILDLSWSDVAEVHSSKVHTILLEGSKSHSGKIQIKDGKLRFLGDTIREIERSRLLAIVPGEPTEANRWSGELSLGVSLRSGNTDQQDTSFYAFARRETAATRWDTEYNADLSEVDNKETANSHRVDSVFDVFLTKRFRITPASATFYKDKFQNIAYRVTPRIGASYDIVDTSDVTWEVFGGPAYQITRFESVPAGEDRTDDTAAAVIGTVFEWDITGDIELDFEYQLTVPLPDNNDYTHHLVTKLSIELTRLLDLDISFIWDRNHGLGPNANGVTPDADDFRTVIGIGIDF